MSEVKDQLICFVQELIDKRLADKKTPNILSLSGTIAQHKEFRDWLKNNFSQDQLRYNLLEFIQKDSHHFHYDFQTGSVFNTNLFETNPCPDSTPIVLKPKLFNDLETEELMDRFEDNLLVLELIISIINHIDNKSMSVSDLIQSIEQKCEKQFNRWKSMIKIKDKKRSESDVIDINRRILIDLMSNSLRPIFSYDSVQNTFKINENVFQWSQLMDCLINTSLIVVKNGLNRHLYRFGRKCLYQLNIWFKYNFEIAFEFMANNGLYLDQIITVYPKEFCVDGVKRQNKTIDLNPRLIGKSRCREFELMYKYGTEIRGGVGIITRLSDSWATIESQIEFTICGQLFRPEFKVICELVEVFGQKLDDLRSFLHSDDRLYFDVKFITALEDIDVLPLDSSYELWFVSRIYNVRHSANCFISSILVDWKSGEWDTSSDGSHSLESYNRYEDNSSDSY